MRKLLFALIMFLALPARAEIQYSEAETLGGLAGMAAACGVGNNGAIFNKLAKRYLINSALSDRIEKAELENYKRAKYNGYVNTKNNLESCSEIVREFDKQEIFKFQVYSDGTLITTDGRILMPRNLKMRDPNAKRIY
ncbi:MAG: hypothetical protein MJ247_04455 [Alphaproteobacteria bacterium]|nr:hypothetical protein [Alphaproteobacteria bacterium]